MKTWRITDPKTGKIIHVNHDNRLDAATQGERMLGIDPFTSVVEEEDQSLDFWDDNEKVLEFRLRYAGKSTDLRFNLKTKTIRIQGDPFSFGLCVRSLQEWWNKYRLGHLCPLYFLYPIHIYTPGGWTWADNESRRLVEP